MTSFSDSRIYSLGQSSAWIVKASQILASFSKKKERKFDYIPFSGSFLESNEPCIYEYGDRPLPGKAEQTNYRKLLKNIGLSPAEIFSQYAKSGQKTVILEYTNSGQSIASFMLILLNWAREEKIKLNDALKIVTFARYNSLLPIRYITINKGDIFVECKNVYADNDLLVALANGINNGSESDRLVPYYPCKSWSLPPVQLEENREHIDRLIKKLEHSIKKHITEKNANEPDYLKGEYSTYWDNCQKEMIRTQEENSARTFDTAAVEVASSNMEKEPDTQVNDTKEEQHNSRCIIS